MTTQAAEDMLSSMELGFGYANASFTTFQAATTWLVNNPQSEAAWNAHAKHMQNELSLVISRLGVMMGIWLDMMKIANPVPFTSPPSP